MPHLKTLDFSNGIPRPLTRFADQMYHDFLISCDEFFTQLSEDKKEDLDWHLSSLASRNNFGSKLFDYLFYLEIVLKYIELGDLPNHIIVDRADICYSLREYFNRKNIQVQVDTSIHKQRRYLYFFKVKIKFLLRYLKFMLTMTRLWHNRWKAARIFTEIPLGTEIMLVDTYLSKQNVAEIFGSHDHYFQNFDRLLSGEERKQIHIIFTPYGDIPDWDAFYFKLKQSHWNFLPKEKYLRVSDFLYAILYPLRLKKYTFLKANYKGIDLTNFVFYLRDKSLFDPNAIEAILNYRFIKRLSKKKIKIKSFLDWYENQCFDRGLHKAFNSFYPDTDTIGYMSYAPQAFQYNLRLLKVDADAGILPKKIWINGPGCVQYFNPYHINFDTKIFTTLRYNHIQKLKKQEDLSNIIITFPYYSEAWKDLMNVYLLFKVFLHSFNKKYKLYVKLHPTMYSLDEIGHIKNRVDLYEGTVQELLPKTAVLVGTGSSICLEALTCSVPVIIAGGTHSYTLNPIPRDVSSEIYSICYQDEEYLEALGHYLSSNFAILKKQKLWQHFDYVKCQYFSPFDKNKVRDMLNLPRLSMN